MVTKEIIDKKMIPFEKIERQIEFDKEGKKQIYFEVVKGNIKKLISFQDDKGEEIFAKELPDVAFIKPFSQNAKLVMANTTEKEVEVEIKIVYGVNIYGQ